MFSAAQTQGKKTNKNVFPNNLQPSLRQNAAMEAANHGEEKDEWCDPTLNQSIVCAWTAHVARV